MSKLEQNYKEKEVMEKILERIDELHEMVKEEGELINYDSESLFLDFTESHLELGKPLITLTPNNNIYASWADAEGILVIVFNPEKVINVVFKKNDCLHTEIPLEIFQRIT
jgi:hypothetical protein